MSYMKAVGMVWSACVDRMLLLRGARSADDDSSAYAFLVHPRDLKDVYRKYPFARYIPAGILRMLLRHMWPVTVSKITGAARRDGTLIEGWMISIAWTADMMVSDRDGARRQVIRAALLAEARGARLIGLGALTASFTRGGLDLLDYVRGSVTTGRLFTSKIVSDIAYDAAHELRIQTASARVAIVGAVGSIGAGVAQLLSMRGFRNINLYDVGKRESRMEELKSLLEALSPGIRVTTHSDMSTLCDADIIVTATNHADALIMPEHVKSCSIIVDDAQPTDVSPEVFTRDDILVLEGGVVNAPGIDAHFNMGLQDKGDIFSCLAEVILLAESGYRGHDTVGAMFQIDRSMSEKLSALAAARGFVHGAFQNMHRAYLPSDIARVAAKRSDH